MDNSRPIFPGARFFLIIYPSLTNRLKKHSYYSVTIVTWLIDN